MLSLDAMQFEMFCNTECDTIRKRGDNMLIHNQRFTTSLCDPICTYRIILPKIYDKVLYWLHGFQERSSDIIFKSNFEELAENCRMAIVIPDLPDTYYLDQPWNDCYTEEFFFEEFI